MLKAGTARAVITPPLTIEQGVWGAKSHVTPRGVESELWATCLVLSDDRTRTALIDLDLCLVPNALADRLRDRVAAALGIESVQVRISATHTHAGPVMRLDGHAANPQGEEAYQLFLVEACVGVAIEAAQDLVEVAVNAGYGSCSVGRSRRQRLDDGLMVAGYAPDEPADPTVSVVRFDAADGTVVASLVHYAAHPTTLGYTNELVSPDYPGVTKRVVESALGGTTLFLQGAAGDIGPGPGGFLSDLALMRSIGTQLGASAVQTLLEAEERQYDHRYVEVVRSGADLGVWSRERRAIQPTGLQVRSGHVALAVKPQPSPVEVQKRCDTHVAELQELKDSGASADQLAAAAVQLRRSNMDLRRAQTFHGVESYDLEIHVIQFGGVVLVGIPIEPFSAIGKEIRERSPFPYTLFGGYSNGANGYLPTREAAEIGGYEVDQMAVAHDSAERLVNKVLEILDDLHQNPSVKEEE